MNNVVTDFSIALAFASIVVALATTFWTIRKSQREQGKINLRRRQGSFRPSHIVGTLSSPFASMVVNLAIGVVLILMAMSTVPPGSPPAQARPYLMFAAIVSATTLVGKFALSAAIVPFLKGIPGALAGIIVKIVWDKWQARKPREPKPQS